MRKCLKCDVNTDSVQATRRSNRTPQLDYNLSGVYTHMSGVDVPRESINKKGCSAGKTCLGSKSS